MVLLRTKQFLLCILLSIFVYSNASSGVADSLINLINSSTDDSIKVNLLNTLSKSFFADNPDSAVTIANTSKSLAEKNNYKAGLALALKNMGIGYYLQGKYVEAINTWQQAQEVYTAIKDTAGIANMLSNEGAVYFNQGDDAQSLELHLKSLKMSEQIGDTLRILTSLINIGTVYLNKPATYNKAQEYFLRAYELSLAIKDNYSIGTATANLGELYYKMGNDSTALVYLKQSVKAYEGTEDLPYALNYIGRIYTRQKEFELALKNHRDAFEISKRLDTRLDMAQSLIGLAQAYYAQGDIVSAIDAYKQSLDVGVPLNAVTEMKDAYEGLARSYARESNFREVAFYQDLLLSIKDTIYNIDADKKLGTLQFTFDLEKKESQINLLTKDKQIQEQVIKREKLVRNGFVAGFAVVLLFAGVFFMQRNRISKEKKRSDELLLNILPAETAEELKSTGVAKAKSLDSATVLFTDFKNFTQESEKLTPENLVAEIHHCYSEFDRIITKHGVEKIKTIGDSYMCAGGLPATNITHPVDVVAAALEMLNFIEENKKEKIKLGQPFFELRIGIHTGSVVAGIVGIKKFSYDIWGDTVNTASRMESSGQAGKINISETTYELVKDKFICVPRGKIEAKHKGMINMYFVEALRS
jgi:adenylate cyclase